MSKCLTGESGIFLTGGVRTHDQEFMNFQANDMAANLLELTAGMDISLTGP
ncbi:hypothetical protein [Winslowiella iniecta]|uniref:hypothetical protein n=1 Tax=Winslowiella iniecta TaxID=1560201 RepID=UPI000A79247E|nr:hypothetical protein [Winslowiella iniecta]